MERKKSKIRVIDDEPFFRKFFVDNLSGEFAVVVAEKESEFLEMARKEQPGLIVLDRLMPEIGGDELCRQLKRDKSTMTIPVVMVTSLGEKDDLITGLEAGADDYVAKPIYMPELLAKIRSRLRAKDIYSSFEKNDLLNVIDVYETVTSFHDSNEILDSVTRKVANAVGAVRCSVVRIEEKRKYGYVLASSEDEDIENLKIDLDKYPELLKAVELKKEIFIDDITKDPITKKVRKNLKGLPFGSVAIIPIAMMDEFIGTLLLRVAAKKDTLEEKDISLCVVVANAAASVLENVRLVESLRLANVELEKLATTDGLTGVYNHRFFYNRLEEEYNISQRYNVPLACIMFDIDFFKNVNDTYGHRKGDKTLMEIAAVITKTIRKTDIAARYGGEEFVILLPHTDEKGGLSEAERMRKAVRKHVFSALPKGERLTISLCIATCLHDAVGKAEDLVKYADKALYEAKASGRDISILYKG